MDTFVREPRISVFPSGENISKVKVSLVSGILSSTGTIRNVLIVSPGAKDRAPMGTLKSPVSAEVFSKINTLYTHYHSLEGMTRNCICSSVKLPPSLSITIVTKSESVSCKEKKSQHNPEEHTTLTLMKNGPCVESDIEKTPSGLSLDEMVTLDTRWMDSRQLLSSYKPRNVPHSLTIFG